MKKGRKKISIHKQVQGAYVFKETKQYLHDNYEEMGFHSATDYAGRILDVYVERKRKNS
jgi:hypothetical protein